VAEGDGGPVAFYAMAFSQDEPAIVYGVDEDLQVSRDGGRTWSKVGKTPGQVFDIAVSGTSPETIYLAMLEGLFRSLDGGKTWTHAYPENRPATMVHVANDGVVHAFLYGLGLVSSPDAQALKWRTIAEDFVDRAVMDLAIHPDKPEVMLGVADTGGVMISRDRGRTWGSFEGQLYATAERIEAGRKLFEENCQACHGVKGVGERPDDIYATDENDLFVAPPLDDSAHAWHHSDDQLIGSILGGSPRNERMVAFKELDVSREDAESLVAYIKSLWNFRSLACQGSRHMSCMQ
jgi:mono/diheme cytochrome c family protein